MTLGTVVAFLSLNKSFNMPISQVSMQANSIIMALAGAERIFKMMDEESETDEGYVTLVNAKYDRDDNLVEATERTATEITSSEGDYNLTIQELQAMWQNGAGQALELCAALGKVYGMPGLSFDAGKDLTMDWGDGVLFDRTRTWNEYMSMVTSGLLRPELALAWYFDLPHADAAQLAKIRKELMPQAAQAAPANNEEKKGETQIGA